MEEFISEALAKVNLPMIATTAINIVMYFLVFLYRAKMNKTGSTVISSMHTLREAVEQGRKEDSTTVANLDERMRRCECALRIILDEGECADGKSTDTVCTD